jgi:hypothetical protein
MRRKSAMLLIVNTPIEAEKVSIFNASTSTIHPLNGARITNTTDLKLPPGPVTVFDGGAYAGDGLIDTLLPGAGNLIGYAVDLEVMVDATMKQDLRRSVVKIVNGMLWEKRTQTFEQTYKIMNNSGEFRRIILEHPFNADRKLVSPATFEEKTPRYYRFRRELAAGAGEDFVVIEERVLEQRAVLDDLSANRLIGYAQTNDISPEVKEALEVAARLKEELIGLESDLGDRENQVKVIGDDQDRLRKNLEATGKDTPLGKRYLEKMSRQEDRIEEMRAEVANLRREITVKQKELSDYLKQLNIE